MGQVIVGLDEVGRGCWAGPLVAAAVILDKELPSIPGLTDSKKLRARQRATLDEVIRSQAVAYGIGWVWPEQIDRLGLTEAVKMAMSEAMSVVLSQYAMEGSLSIIIDGSYNFLPQYDNVTTIVKADGIIPAVSAASIIAKVARDTYMATIAHAEFPQYGFDRHVGYGTALHIQGLQQNGVAAIHRKSYKPIQQFLIQSQA